MRTKTPFRRKRLISRGSSSSTSVEVKVERELQCSRCKAIFPDYLARCPECGSEEWIGLVEVNPYTRMPMETFLKACGHLLGWWTIGFRPSLADGQPGCGNQQAVYLRGVPAALLQRAVLRRLLRHERDHAPHPPYAAAAPRLPRKLPRRSTRKGHTRTSSTSSPSARAGLRFAY
ncbi:MAG: translation initiation factor IF-2 [Bilophila wadsworthia]